MCFWWWAYTVPLRGTRKPGARATLHCLQITQTTEDPQSSMTALGCCAGGGMLRHTLGASSPPPKPPHATLHPTRHPTPHTRVHPQGAPCTPHAPRSTLHTHTHTMRCPQRICRTVVARAHHNQIPPAAFDTRDDPVCTQYRRSKTALTHHLVLHFVL